MVCFLLSHTNCNILYQNEVKLFTMVWRETMVIVDNRVWGFSQNMRFGVPWVQQMYFYQRFCPWYVSVCRAGERKLLDRFPPNLEQTYELFQSAYQSREGGGLKHFENQSHFGPKTHGNRF